MSLACRCCVIALLLLLGACSSTTFFYNRLTFLVPWYVDDYVELSRSQEDYLEQLLLPFLRWHRMEELPRYVEVLDRSMASLERPLTAEDVAAVSLDIEIAGDRLQRRALEWMISLAGDLSDEQIAEFMEELREKQEEYEEEYLTRSDEEYREEVYDRLLDNTQDYLGRLDRTQREVLRRSCDELMRSDAAWLAERAEWLDRLALMLQRQPGWQQALRDAVDQRYAMSSPQYREMYSHNLGVMQAALARLINSRSERQDRRLRKELGELREDLETLIREGREAEAA